MRSEEADDPTHLNNYQGRCRHHNQHHHHRPVTMLHQQTSMCSPMSPILGGQNLIDNPSSQLLRSKSLNDISNESLVLAHDLSINFQGLQQRQTNNNILSNIGSNLIASYDTHKEPSNAPASALHQTNNGTTCMDMFSYYDQKYNVYHTPPNLNNLGTTTAPSNNHALNDQFVSGQIDQATTFYRDPRDNECSNNGKQNTSSVTNSASSTNMFNICNPIVMNLNGVTEQIGNLHL